MFRDEFPEEGCDHMRARRILLLTLKEMGMRNATRCVLGAAALAFTVGATAQKPAVYPAKGQSTQQQKKDDGACYGWAKSNTGIDPAVVAQTPPPPSGPAVGGGERLKGAARGAVVGEIAGGHGGEGAAAGALVGGARARKNQAAQQQQAQGQKAQTMDTFYRAYGACMEGRGYTVK